MAKNPRNRTKYIVAARISGLDDIMRAGILQGGRQSDLKIGEKLHFMESQRCCLLSHRAN